MSKRGPKPTPAVGTHGIVLRRLRDNAGLTIREVALSVGITRSHYHDIEKGKSRLRIVEVSAFAKLYHTTSCELLKQFMQQQKAFL